ncbi:unnamed protein product [Rangifer tarandus platyrhynchus]|uniref:Uncharacterized protein n=2 Tax=Rangifer tarandus platyrhynchus TaxID=3082113 RepID=A0AC59ZRM8_RANTA|nr:unnamed protein product [Rangifer tarandus platyrhynchus]
MEQDVSSLSWARDWSTPEPLVLPTHEIQSSPVSDESNPLMPLRYKSREADSLVPLVPWPAPLSPSSPRALIASSKSILPSVAEGQFPPPPRTPAAALPSFPHPLARERPFLCARC